MCWWCKRELTEQDTGRRVFIGFGTAWMCDACYAKNDPEVPVDYTEPEFDRESQPEFEGVFKW